jgi:E3 ubiquitin-protein ligase TRIP12
MDAGDDAVLQYALPAIADESAGAGEAAAALAALCDVLAVSGPDFILDIPHAGLAARLPALLAGGSGCGGGGGGDVPLLAARAIAEACEAAPEWASRFARHGAVEALRDRLLAVDCIELAEEVGCFAGCCCCTLFRLFPFPLLPCRRTKPH